MPTTIGSVMCSDTRVALHTENTDWTLINPGRPYILAACVEMDQNLLSTDLWSINWRYRTRGSILPWLPITLDSDGVYCAGTFQTVLVHGAVVTSANKRCINNGSHVDCFTERDVNTFGSGTALNIGQNSEAQIAIRFDRAKPGNVIELNFRVNIGGVDNDSNLIRVNVPDNIEYYSNPNPKMALTQKLGWDRFR